MNSAAESQGRAPDAAEQQQMHCHIPSQPRAARWSGLEAAQQLGLAPSPGPLYGVPWLGEGVVRAVPLAPCSAVPWPGEGELHGTCLRSWEDGCLLL